MFDGMPDSFFGMVGSEEELKPEWPNCAYAPECNGSRSLA